MACINYQGDESILEVARILCDRNRDNDVFLNALERKIAEIEGFGDAEENSQTGTLGEGVLYYRDVPVNRLFELSMEDVIGTFGTPQECYTNACYFPCLYRVRSASNSKNLRFSSLCGCRRKPQKMKTLPGEQAPHSVSSFFEVPGS